MYDEEKAKSEHGYCGGRKRYAEYGFQYQRERWGVVVIDIVITRTCDIGFVWSFNVVLKLYWILVSTSRESGVNISRGNSRLYSTIYRAQLIKRLDSEIRVT